MTTPIAQRTITITVNPVSASSARLDVQVGDGENKVHLDVAAPAAARNDVTYSYWSPVSGMSYTNAQQCDLKIDRPTYCLFVLDFQSSLAGWTITKTEPYGDSAKLAFVKGPNELSIQTYNPYKNVGDTYRYYIFYKNILTGEVFSEDPQEGNVIR